MLYGILLYLCVYINFLWLVIEVLYIFNDFLVLLEIIVFLLLINILKYILFFVLNFEIFLKFVFIKFLFVSYCWGFGKFVLKNSDLLIKEICCVVL